MMELPKKTPVRSYKTDFTGNETPISEGGMWLNGRKDGIDWCDVLVRDGVAFGEVSRNRAAERRAEQEKLGAGAAQDAPVGDYDDPTAVLTGSWGPISTARPACSAAIRRRSTSRRCRSV
jgi:hypothetical protein